MGGFGATMGTWARHNEIGHKVATILHRELATSKALAEGAGVNKQTITRIADPNQSKLVGNNLAAKVGDYINAAFPNITPDEHAPPTSSSEAADAPAKVRNELGRYLRSIITNQVDTKRFAGTYLCYRFGAYVKKSVVISAIRIFECDDGSIGFHELKVVNPHRNSLKPPNAKHPGYHNVYGSVVERDAHLIFLGFEDGIPKLTICPKPTAHGIDGINGTMLFLSTHRKAPCSVNIHMTKVSNDLTFNDEILNEIGVFTPQHPMAMTMKPKIEKSLPHFMNKLIDDVLCPPDTSEAEVP